MRIAVPDSNPIYVGRPGKRKGFGGNRRNNASADGGDSHGQLLEVQVNQPFFEKNFMKVKCRSADAGKEE